MWGLLLARGKLGLMMGIEGAKIDYAVQLLGVPTFIKSIMMIYRLKQKSCWKPVLRPVTIGLRKAPR
jgi:hypothetical protein